MDKHIAKELLTQELENKKMVEAYKSLECWVCHNEIEEGEEFCFLAGRGICNDCRAGIAEMVESNL